MLPMAPAEPKQVPEPSGGPIVHARVARSVVAGGGSPRARPWHSASVTNLQVCSVMCVLGIVHATLWTCLTLHPYCIQMYSSYILGAYSQHVHYGQQLLSRTPPGLPNAPERIILI